MTRAILSVPLCANGSVSSPRAIVANDRAAAESLRSVWSAIREQSGVVTADADPDFFLGIYESLGEHVAPHIVALDSQALIVGRITTTVLGSRIGYVNLPTPRLRCLEVVHGGLITNGDKQATSFVINHLKSMLRDGNVDLIEIQHLAADQEICSEIMQAGISKRITVDKQPHFTLELTDGQTGQRIVRHSSKTRSTFRREDKRLQEHFGGDLNLTIAKEADLVEYFLLEADRINRSSYHRGLNAGITDNRQWRAIVSTLARCGGLRGYLLVGAGQPIAYMLGAKFGGECTLMATGYVPEHQALSPGKVLMNRVLNSLADQKTHIVDFGWGEAEYKNVFTSHRREDLTIRLFGDRLRSRVAYAIDRGSAAASRQLKSIAGGSRVQGWRRRWRQRMQTSAKASPRQPS